MLRRVAVFSRQHGALFPENSLAHELLNTIQSVLEELNEHSVSQVGGIHDAQSHTKAKTRVREALRAGLMEIARTARLISRTIPRFDEPFQFPRSKSDTALLHAARQFAEKAAAVSDAFIRHAMRPDFIDDLNANIQKVEKARHDRFEARATHRKATAAIDAALQKAMTALADFDILIANILRNDNATMAVWKSARHVKRARKRKAAAAAAQSDPPSDSLSDSNPAN
jgi:hypothetical protein